MPVIFLLTTASVFLSVGLTAHVGTRRRDGDTAEVERLKTEILRKLNANAGAPNVAPRLSDGTLRRSLRAYRDSVRQIDRLDDVADGHEGARNYHHYVDVGLPVRNQTSSHLYFDVDLVHPADVHSETHVHSARLTLHFNTVRPRRISLYALRRTVRSSGERVPRTLVSSLRVSAKDVTLDVTRQVVRWLDDDSNYGLEVRCGGVGRCTALSNADSSKPAELRVISEVRKIVPTRQKRSTDHNDCTPGINTCCRRKTYIDFKEIGWDAWVLMPEGFDVYYCSGSCAEELESAHSYPGIMAALRRRKPGHIPSACCQGHDHRPLTILHLDELGGPKVSLYQDMKVGSCRCV